MNADNHRPFGELLRRYRSAAGVTQEELAERAGITAKAVGALERGERRQPWPDTVRRLANALGLSEDARAAFLAAVSRQPVAAPLPTPQWRLPAPLTPVVGRRREVADVRRLLAEARLVTLTGVGGADGALPGRAARPPGARQPRARAGGGARGHRVAERGAGAARAGHQPRPPAPLRRARVPCPPAVAAPGQAGRGERGGAALRPSGPGGTAGLRADRGEPGRGGRDLRAARWLASGDRAGGGARPPLRARGLART